MKKKSIAIITGASSGIGMEFALQIDAHLRKTDELWLIARDRIKLATLTKRLRNNCKVLSMDLSNEAQIERLKSSLEDENCEIRLLVNCAGFGLMGKAESLDSNEQSAMVRLNCEALTNVTLSCLKYMANNGRIIQMASSAAFFPQPGFAVYAATKAYVDSFSVALNEELKSRGIVVTSVCPGPVDTPFFDVAEKNGKSLAIKKLCMADPYFVVDQALRDSIILKKKRSVYSLPIKVLQLASKFIPDGLWVPLVWSMKEDQ